MPAMPVATVRKMTGAMIIFTSLMKASPSGFMRVADFGIEVAEQHAGGDRRQHLHIEMPVERKFAARRGGSECCLHDVLHCAPIESSTSRSVCI